MLENTRNGIFTLLKEDRTVAFDEMLAFLNLLKGTDAMTASNEATEVKDADGEGIDTERIFNTKEAMSILGLTKSTIAFYDRRGFLHPMMMRTHVNGRVSTCKYYEKDEVYALKRARAALDYVRCPTTKIKEMLEEFAKEAEEENG